MDATPLTAPTGGVARYTFELSRALARNFPDDEYWLVSDQKYAYPGAAIDNLKRGRGPANALERRWWLWGLQGVISELRIDVFHGADFAVPYLPLRASVMTVHDLSPWLDASWHANAGRVRRRTPLLLRLGRATMLITPSEAIRKAVVERFRVPPDRVAAIPHGAGAQFRPVAAEPCRTPYFLYVGTIEPRKNLRMLIEAWRETRKLHTVDLVLAGGVRENFGALPGEPGLHVMGRVDEERLPALYSGAVACVYPSLYEGFGLPVLEAMQCGALVVTSRDPAIGEVAEGGAIRIEASDVRAWAETLARAASEPEWAAAWREKALVRAAAFSWDRTAARTREVYAEARRRFGRG